MIVGVLIGLLVACAGAVPRPNYGLPPSFYDDINRNIQRNLIDTEKFLDELNRDLNKMNKEINTMVANLPPVTEEFQGQEYKIVIGLPGFKEKEIAVNARSGQVRIEAVHREAWQQSNNYLLTRSLPVCVADEGYWAYSNDLLTLVFPVTSSEYCGKFITSSPRV